MEAAERLIICAKRVFVATHAAPDGDAIGSLLGLGRALRKAGKVCTLACADPVPVKLAFLPGSEEVTTCKPSGEDLIIVLDCSDLKRLGTVYDEASFKGRPILNIDHHVTNLRFGTVNWVDATAAAAAEQVYDLMMGLGIPLDPSIATCLLTGIVTDTRGFRTPNTTACTLRIAARLMEAGALLAEISEQVFNRRPFSTVRLWGKVVGEAQRRGRIVWGEVTQAALRQCAASPDEGSGIVNFLASTQGADVAVVFAERGCGQIEVDMRARRGVDLSGVALHFGGGGHPQAAGCCLNGSLVEAEERVLAEIERSLR